MSQLLALLDDYNLKLTNIQKIVVSTIGSANKGRVNLTSPAADQLARFYTEALNDLIMVEGTLKAATLSVMTPAPEESIPAGLNQPTAQGQPTLARREAQPAAAVKRPVSPATGHTPSGLDELKALSQHLAQNTITTAVTKRYGAQAGAAASQHLEEAAPTLAPRPQMSEQEAEILRQATLPVTEDPNSELMKQKRADERVREELLKMIVQHVIYGTFSRNVVANATGLYEPTYDVDRYSEDIGTLKYERLKGWSEGFYENAVSHSFQYLAKLDDIIAIIDFSHLGSPSIEKQQRFIDIISLDDPGRTRYAIALLDNDTLKSIALKLSNHFGRILHGKYHLR